MAYNMMGEETTIGEGEPLCDLETGVYRPAETKDDMMKCRYYRGKYPEVDDLVMVNVRNVEQLGAYVSLLEFNDIEGMVLLSELSRRRIRSINKLIRVGRKEVVMVLRVDKEKGYVDLSKRRVPAEDVAKFTSKYNKSKTVHSILHNVAAQSKIMLEDMYINIGWPLYLKYGHAYDAFKMCITEQEKILGPLNIPDHIVAKLMGNIKRRLAANPVKVRADIDVTCFTREGIDAIKAALMKGKQVCGDSDDQISIKLIAPPLYVLFLTKLDKAEGIATLEKAIKAIKETIVEKGGRMVVRVAPHATTEQDDLNLKEQMEKMANSNREVDGDADGDS